QPCPARDAAAGAGAGGKDRRPHSLDPPPPPAAARRRGAHGGLDRQGAPLHRRCRLVAGRADRRREAAPEAGAAAGAVGAVLMLSVRLQSLNDFAEWRGKARQLLAAGVPPEQVVWRTEGDENGLFEGGDTMLPEARPGAGGTVPRQFIEAAEIAINHSDPQRFALLYRQLWRLQKDPGLLADAADAGNGKLSEFCKSVRRDSHKMKAFVRFRSIAGPDGDERFAAWFEPEHYTLEMTAPFFARRFDGMVWAVVTPYRSAFWDTETLMFGPGGQKSDVPAEDAVEEDWRTYFSSIFNPARLKVSMMKSEMPVKYWRNLPEAERIAPLIRNARQMEQEMIARAATEPPARHLRQQARAAQENETPDE